MIDTPAAAARQTLHGALIELATQQRRPPCAEPGQPDPYGRDAEERAEAATLCAQCPLQGPCAAAGEHEDAGVWGGHDRTPRPGRRTQSHPHCDPTPRGPQPLVEAEPRLPAGQGEAPPKTPHCGKPPAAELAAASGRACAACVEGGDR